MERHGLQVDGLEDEAGSVLRDGAGVGGVRAFAAAAGGSVGFEAVGKGGLEALNGGMEINAVEHPQGGLHVPALVLEPPKQRPSFLQSRTTEDIINIVIIITTIIVWSSGFRSNNAGTK